MCIFYNSYIYLYKKKSLLDKISKVYIYNFYQKSSKKSDQKSHQKIPHSFSFFQPPQNQHADAKPPREKPHT